MAPKKREKILAAATGVLLVVLAGVYLLSGRGRSLKQLRAQREQWTEKVQQQEIEARPGRKAAGQLRQWRTRSLPADPNVAHRLYVKWLRELALDRVEFRQADITPQRIRPHRGIYTALPFSIECRGTLDQLTRFLFEFYSVGYLHKIHNLIITPVKGSEQLKLVISVEALCLPGAAQEDQLPSGAPGRLQLADLVKYREAIVRRRMEEKRFVDSGGLFASYVPPPVANPERQGPREPPPSGFDPSEHTYVNAIHAVDGLPEVWLFVRTEGRTLVLHEGDPFEVGRMSGKIARIRVDQLDVEIEVDGGDRCRIDFGDNLHQGVDLPD